MIALNLKPTHKAIKDYYAELQKLSALHVAHEGAVSPAFATLLRRCGTQFGQQLVEKHSMKRVGHPGSSHPIFVDGALFNEGLLHGVWEAKDTSDDLEKEVKKKFADGYPKDNILFQAPDQVIIWQDGNEVYNQNISTPEYLIEGLRIFFEYRPPAFKQWQQAVEEFKLQVQDLATGLLGLIERERVTNETFTRALEAFTLLCRETINPNISTAAVEEMLIQHVLTERIFRKVFNNPDFAERNIIAREIEKVISALTSHYFSRHDFLKPLDRFYVAIETTAATIEDFSQKQSFLNTVYENFFQGFSVKVADIYGIVYTPQPIVKFMVRSVEEILQREFGRSLSNEGVHIIDPFVGTGNFIVWIMREIQRIKLSYKYFHELHCNEVMLLPYYIASMNIEHEYCELTSTYEPFKGVCLVDTFEITEGKQLSYFIEDNTARVKRQQSAPIFVIIGNPPYNAGQVNENDNNKNRKYPELEKRIYQTYGKGSKATLLRKLNDPYVKAIRWASDRIGNEGIVTLVTNHSFLSGVTFDGMRKHLEGDFDAIHVLDLGGNVRKNPKLSGTTHNVFGIQVGVSINILVRKKDTPSPKQASIYYASVDEFWRKEQKYDFLDEKKHLGNIEWKEIQPDDRHNWLTVGMSEKFDSFMPIGTKEAKASRKADVETIFKMFSLGVSTNRDRVVYDFNMEDLASRVEQFCDDYNTETMRYHQKGKPSDIDSFVNYEKVQWSSTLKNHTKSGTLVEFDRTNIRSSLYRPFTRMLLYYDSTLNDRPGLFPRIFPDDEAEAEKRAICVPSVGGRSNFWCICVGLIPNLALTSIDANQCFPLYTYSEDSLNRQENVTDWALDQYRVKYDDHHISKWDIFHYVYAVLHHPQYREKYAANLKRELPRIPFAPDFWGFVEAGTRLAELHVNYDRQEEYHLKWCENKDVPLNWCVEKMKLAKDKTHLIYNDFLTLGSIPPEVFKYRLGNRSALDWVIDQYQVKTDKRSGIVNDPNRMDDEQYIVRLIGKVVTISLETMKIIKGLPKLE